jgi:hypothetical protein
MMKLKLTRVSIFFAILVVSITGCSYEDIPAGSIKPGVYKGSYARTSIYGRYVSSSVTLTITGNQFRGESSVEKYPAICNGTYSVSNSGSEVSFRNACFFTAEFDWSLILNGTFKLKVDSRDLEISRTSGITTDIYRLTLQ